MEIQVKIDFDFEHPSRNMKRIMSEFTEKALPNVEKQLKNNITDFKGAPISQTTATVRRIRNNMSKKPLIDSGALLKSIKKNIKTIESLLKNGEKWNVFGVRKFFGTKIPGVLGAIGNSFIIGDVVDAALPWDVPGGTAGKVATGYVTKKIIEKQFIPRALEMMGTKTGREFLYKKLGRKTAESIMKKIAWGKKGGRFGLVAAGIWSLYDVGKFGIDTYNEIMNANPEDYKEGTE